MGLGAAIAGGTAAAGIAGSMIQGGAAKSAANTAASADQAATQAQLQMFNQSEADLKPYNQVGQAYLPQYGQFWDQSAKGLQNYLDLMQSHIPGQITSQNISDIPGYQQTLQQGESALQNAAAAKGLGVSGAALKGATNYGTGLAQQGYQNLFNNQQTIYGDYGNLYSGASNLYNTAFNQLSNVTNQGENAAARQGQNAVTTGQGIAGSTQAAGAAQAAGTTAAGNAMASGLNSVGNAGLNYLGIQNMLSNNGGNNGGAGGFYDNTSSFVS